MAEEGAALLLVADKARKSDLSVCCTNINSGARDCWDACRYMRFTDDHDLRNSHLARVELSLDFGAGKAGV